LITTVPPLVRPFGEAAGNSFARPSGAAEPKQDYLHHGDTEITEKYTEENVRS
jgi:hypothetical protein